MRGRLLFGSLGLLAACAAPPPPPAPIALLAPTATEAPAAPRPPRLVIRPVVPSNLRGYTRLAPGEALVVGQDGERWLLDEATGVGRPSTFGLPEDLDAVTRSRTGTNLFVGTSGTVYAATDPLGPIGAARPAPSVMRGVAAGSGAVVGIDRAGAIVRTVDAGATWSTIVAADPNVDWMQLAMNDDGHGLALGVPHRVLATVDAGATWQPVATPGFGAVRVHVTLAGAVLLEGTKGFAALERDPPRLEKLARDYADVKRELGIAIAKPRSARPWKRASAIRVDGERVWALVTTDDDKTMLARGALGDDPELTPIDVAKGAHPSALAARGGFLAIGVSAGGSETDLFTSDDDGASWKPAGKGRGADVAVWISPRGVLYTRRDCDGSGSAVSCDEGLARRGEDEPVTMIRGGRVADVVFDERRSETWAVVTSLNGDWRIESAPDGGAFSVVEPPPGGFPRAPAPIDLEHALSIDDDGTARLAFSSGRNTITLLARGSSGAWEPPRELPLSTLALAGRRGLAIDPWGSILETLDAGVTFRRVADGERPIELRDARTFSRSSRWTRCSSGGCIVDDRVTRVGWTTTPTGEPWTPTAGDELASGSTLACTLDHDWVALGRAGLPNIDDYIPGSAVRFQVSRIDRKTGAAGAWIWRESPAGLVLEEKALFPAAPRDAATDGFAELGVAGAIRYAFKREKATPGARGEIKPQPVDVELAWVETENGKIHRVKLPRAKLLDPSKDIETLDTGVAIAKGDEAVRREGIYIRPFAISSTGGALFFVKSDGKVESMTWPETKGAPNQDYEPVAEIARANGRTVILHGRRDGMQLETSWWNRATKDWDARTWSGWPGLVLGLGAQVWWGAGRRGQEATARIGMTGTDAIPAGQWQTSLVAPTNDPTFVAFPGQSSLGDPPRACTGKSDQAYSASQPYAVGHPVVVEGDGPPRVLYTAYALERSDDGEPCAYAYDARAAEKGATDQRAFVLLSDLAHAAFFKKDDATKEVSYRSMTCRWDKRPVPKALANASGFQLHPSRPY